MSHAQRPPAVPPPDRRSALLNLWRMVDSMADDFFVPTPENGAERPLAWKFQNVTQSLKMQTTSAHSTPLRIIYRISLGKATPDVRYMVVYVLDPKDRSDIQANKDAFKRGLIELVNDPQSSMTEAEAQ
ncbi:hypothetical protein GSI_02569 [Ganoderma sinense ZZ0214-1]|uniref:Uncharacterized protein n=1 Tax=Ganoderma sinense ZZ0214-1 TaxID=1077348 RepID=A0A2G8SLZ8_9APHY|nr:hypothetical protein GSI_02569 [Ganoderma sinense ZZ0214-1]